jgi:hypothetical protein
MANVPAVDPWSAAFNAFGPALTAAAQPAGPSSAWQSSDFNDSGWSVNIGSGSANASATSVPAAAAALGQASAGIAGLLGSPVVLIALAALFILNRK